MGKETHRPDGSKTLCHYVIKVGLAASNDLRQTIGLDEIISFWQFKGVPREPLSPGYNTRIRLLESLTSIPGFRRMRFDDIRNVKMRTEPTYQFRVDARSSRLISTFDTKSLIESSNSE